MKKLIIFMLVLGLTSVANAGIVDIVISSLNGKPITPTNEITIDISDTINFDIIYTSDPGRFLFGLSSEIYLELAGGRGTLTVTDVALVTWPTGYWDSSLSGVQMTADGNIQVWGTAKELTSIPAIGEPLVVIDHFLFHCLDYGDVYIGIKEDPTTPVGASIELDEMANFYLLDYSPAVLVHQIPEPMTILLLGLGGLFLRRRK